MNGISEDVVFIHPPERTDECAERPAVVVGLLWHSVNSDNLGVGALTVSHIALIDEVAKSLRVAARYIVISVVDEREPYIRADNVETFDVNGRALVKLRGGLRDAIRRCDIILDIGGGDGFSDVYSVNRFLYLFLSKWMVVSSGRPLILGPQTIGPFNRWWTAQLAGRVMRRCTMVVARDHLSFRLLQEMGLRDNIMEATDVAMALPYDSPAARTGDKLKIGLNVSGLLFNGGEEIKTRFGLQVDYPALIEDILSYFSAMEECEIHLIGHVLASWSPLEDDGRAMTALAKRFINVHISPNFFSPSEAKTYIAGMDFFMGARMHSCIAAFSSGVPVVPMAYTRKFAGLFNSVDYPLVADCTKEDSEQIMARIRDGFERREELRARVREGHKKAENKLAEYTRILATEFRRLPVLAGR